MSLDAGAPRRRLAALRGRVDAGVLERTTDRVGADDVVDVLEGSLSAVVAPRRVLNDELHGESIDGLPELDTDGIGFRLVGPFSATSLLGHRSIVFGVTNSP